VILGLTAMMNAIPNRRSANHKRLGAAPLRLWRERRSVAAWQPLWLATGAETARRERV
jgi:hypothetical protein